MFVGNHYGGASGLTYIESLQCSGNEMSLAECQLVHVFSCVYDDAASIFCDDGIGMYHRLVHI